MTFDQWWKSDQNPLQRSTDAVRYFAKEAMREAWNAGRENMPKKGKPDASL